MSWVFPYRGETEDLNEAVRANVSGSFVQLSDGCTHYELGGEQNGQPVVLVHGFSVPYFIWDPTFDFLIKSCFRVLRYDLFGRGYSDRLKVRYDIDIFCKQLRELLDTLGIEQVNLIGLSMGGPITASFTGLYPNLVERLVLIDPAGAKPVFLSKLLRAVLLPGFGELALGLFGSEVMLKGIAGDFFGPDLVQEFQEKYRVQMKFKGFKRALLATMRNGMLGDFSSAYRKVGELGTPTMLFWGRDDKTVPFVYSDDARTAIPQVEFHAIEHCGHIPHYEKPEEVNPLLLEFLT
jgi:pimeloyl-ACP methyl ester carboxylesterase